MKKMMKLWMLLVPMALAIAGCAVDNPVVVEVTDGKPFSGDKDIDASVRPGNDYYRYALGAWLNNEDREANMADEVAEQLTGCQENVLLHSSDPVISHLRSLSSEALDNNAQLMELMRQRLQSIEAITTAEDRDAMFAKLHQDGYAPFFQVIALPWEGKVRGLFTHGGKSNTVTNCLRYQNPEGLKSEIEQVVGYLESFGFSEERRAEILLNATVVEFTLADIYIDFSNMLRHPWEYQRGGKARRAISTQQSATYEKILGLMGLGAYVQQLEPLDYWSSVYDDEAIESTLGLLDRFGSEDPVDVATLRDYMIYNTLSQDIVFLPSLTAPGFSNSEQNLVRLLQYVTRPIAYHMYRLCTNAFGPQNIHKKECEDIMENMRQLFDERLATSTWLSDATKEQARMKLKKMKFYVGYPDEWNDRFTPEAEGENLLAAVGYLRHFQRQCMASLIGEDALQVGWDLAALYTDFTTDNSFYTHLTNSLVLLPAYLTDARFSPQESEAKQYATAIVFGHEISHGFDANGSQYGADGMISNWWTDADKKEFENKQQKMIELYSQLEIYEGLHVNGAVSLTENMADYGGTTLALELYKRRLKQQGYSAAGIDEQLQKFFLSYAQIWKSTNIMNKSYLDEHYNMLNEPHADEHIRINGIVRLMDDWYRIYDVQPGDALYVAPEDRVKIW